MRKIIWNAVGRVPITGLIIAVQTLFTYFLVAVTHVFFGAPSIGDAWHVLTHATSGLGKVLHLSYIQGHLLTISSIGINAYTFIYLLIAIVAMEIVQYLAARGRTLDAYPRYARAGAYALLLLAIFAVGNFTPLPFIYVRF